ncbi:MAG: ubiquinol-cytochrome c reductase iron-sulfur subunit [Armatimonadota bacterium]
MPLITRRRLLGYLSGLLSAAIAAALALPLARFYVGNAFRPRAARWLRLGPAADIPPNQPTLFTVSYVDQDGWRETNARQEVYAITRNGKDFVVFSNICTHLGCPVHWDDGRKQFICPCHGGVFGIDGRVLHGPPPRPLAQLRHRAENGQLYVQVGEG